MTRKRPVLSIEPIHLIVWPLLSLSVMLTLLPFLYVITTSLVSAGESAAAGIVWFPREPSLEAYRYILSSPTMVRSMLNTIAITLGGTAVNLFFTLTMAYPLAIRSLKGQRFILFLVLFTMLFSGGLIPLFLVVRDLALLDSLWSVILPAAIAPMYVLILRNFYRQLPDGLIEAASMDGANELQTFTRIVLPLSVPAIATFALLYGVNHWNSFFHAAIFINDSNKWPIQIILRQIVLLSSGGLDGTIDSGDALPPAQSIKMAIIVASALPIMLVYPLIQKYFDKGILLGSVKG